jgi:predicted nuclease of predicted toxin-antitoxin system
VSKIRFQFDEHVSPAVARGLRQHGVDVRTATDAGLVSTPDELVLARAFAESRVVVTHDDDYLRCHHEGQPHAGVAHCAQQIRSIGELVEALLLIYEAMTPSEIAGQVRYL